MTDPTHFHNFAPCEAVQYDGTNAATVSEWFLNTSMMRHEDGSLYMRWNGVGEWVHLGDWLIRQGDRVWVQNEEPPRVVEWEWGVSHVPSEGEPTVRPHRSESAARADYDSCGMFCAVVRRPVLSNGWTRTEWEVVE